MTNQSKNTFSEAKMSENIKTDNRWKSQPGSPASVLDSENIKTDKHINSSDKILLIGFDKNISVNISSLFPEIEIDSVPEVSSPEALWPHFGAPKYIFINNDPEIYLNLIKDTYYILYPGNNTIRYNGPKYPNMHKISDHFMDKEVFVFTLPEKLHFKNLETIAKHTGETLKCADSGPENLHSKDFETIAKDTGETLKCADSGPENLHSKDFETIAKHTDETLKCADSGDCVLDIKFEHKHLLAGFIFARIFSFLIEMPSQSSTMCDNGFNDEDINNTNFIESSSPFQTAEALLQLYPHNQNRHIYDWLEITPTRTQPLLNIKRYLPSSKEECIKILEDYSPVRTTSDANTQGITDERPRPEGGPEIQKQELIHKADPESRVNSPMEIKSKSNNTSQKICLLPIPETMEDILWPIYTVLDKISQHKNPLKQIYKEVLPDKRFPIIGDSLALNILCNQISPVLNDRTGHVLIIGEAGSGKELVANIIMDFEGHKCESINCSHLPYNLALSILFGHTKGAFTGADNEKTGYIREKLQGSLFMDEIQSLSKDVVPMLLRYLESGEFVKLGENKTRKSLVRIIAACNDDTILTDKFSTNGFLSRFRYIIRVPSLKYRTADIPILIEHFTQKAKNDLYFAENEKLTAPQVEILKTSDWQHSNVRGLKNAVYNILARNHQNGIAIPAKPSGKLLGRKKSMNDHDLLNFMRTAKDSKDLKNKIKSLLPANTNLYQSKASMRQRIKNAKDFDDELKKLFEDKFAKDY